MKSLEVDFFFSFRSPWSYFAATKLLPIQQAYAVDIHLRVVDPMCIRIPDFFERAHEKWKPYFLTDLIRSSEYFDIPIALPRPDPIDESLPFDSPQHLVLQLNPLGIAAQQAGRGLAFAQAISAMVWDGSIDGWNTGEHLAQATQKAGLDLLQLQQWLDNNQTQWPDLLASNNTALEQHHWGVPTMLFNGEPFFGQDKIDQLLWRLKQKGLQPRSA